MSPRLATALLFVVHGAVVGTWIALVPAIQANLGASATQMGLCILCAAVGALVAMPITGQALTHVSSRRVLIVTSLVFPLLAPLPALAPTPVALGAVLFVFGAVNGAMDVTMNAHGVALERSMGRPILSSLHAGWSLGGMIGALAVAGATALSIAPVVEATAAGLALWCLAAVALRFVGVGSQRSADAPRLSLPSRRVLPIGVLAVGVALVEGGLNDWSGIHLRRDLAAPADVAAAAYAALALGMTVARLGGDALNLRYGAVALLRWGMVLVAGAVGLVLLANEPLVALAALVLAGAGVANGLPLLFAAGGRMPPHGPSLSAVFTMGYLAFVVGPPTIGVITDAVSLPLALGLLALVAVAVAVATGRVQGLERPGREGLTASAVPLPSEGA